MASFCEHCGASLAPGSRYCTVCGAPLAQDGGAAAQAVQEAPEAAEIEPGRVTTPRTIAELLAFCERHKLPLAKMRFFIGLDYPGAKAFGIYQDRDGQFVVYKNKADGSRAVRYRGPDEAHAVSEIFEKLKSEATVQRAHAASLRAQNAPQGSDPRSFETETRLPAQKKRKARGLLIGLVALAAAITIGRTVARVRPHIQPGYYHYGGQTYYSQQGDWYGYDDALDYWFPVSVDDELQNHAGDYYASYSYDTDYGVSDFADSQYYSYDYSYDSDTGSSSSWDWDWDDDSDWDSGSDWDWDSDWDSDYGDWDSDW